MEMLVDKEDKLLVVDRGVAVVGIPSVVEAGLRRMVGNGSREAEDRILAVDMVVPSVRVASCLVTF